MEQFRSNRNYYLHKEEFSAELDMSEKIDVEERIGLVERIENPKLLKGLLSLNKNEMSIINLHYVQKLSLSDISSLKNEKFDTVRKRLYRAKGKLKKYF